MLRRYQENINEIVEKILEGPVKVKPIGNHELNRHLVYYVQDSDENEYVIKFYFKVKRYNRELFSLKNLGDYGVCVPKVHKWGVCEDGIEWILSEYRPGNLLEEVLDDMTQAEQLMVYKSVGDQLGRIHKSFTFDKVIDFNSDQSYKDRFDEFYCLMDYYLDEAIKSIEGNKTEDYQLLRITYENLKESIKVLNGNVTLRLCHNDFGERNILVNKINDHWEVSAVIDFENTIPSDGDFELVRYYLELKSRSLELAEAFRIGYEKHLKIDDLSLDKKKEMYRQYFGLEICSWSKDVAPEYYKVGLKYIMDNRG